MLKLLQSRQFWPLFVTQFLGALNDNVFKSALVVLVTFQLADASGVDGPVMVTAAAGIFIVPFFVFSATAGQLADRYDKARLARWVKAAEVLIMIAGAMAFFRESLGALMAVLFLMGTQSALFGPVKYAILPQHLALDQLITANAMVEAGTFLAILLGTIVGGLLVLTENGLWVVAGLIVSIAVLGAGTSLLVPKAPSLDRGLVINFNVFSSTRQMIGHARRTPEVFWAVMGISWFWLVGATFLSQFPTFAKDVLNGDEEVVTLFLATFSVGIAVGSGLCSWLLKGRISAKYVPFAALLMSAFMVDLYFSSGAFGAISQGARLGVGEFLNSANGLRVSADLVMVAVGGGLYIVPLYAVLQSRGAASHRARDIAANNILNALFMVVSAVVVGVMLSLGVSVPEVFLSVALINTGVAVGAFFGLRRDRVVIK